MVMEATFFFYFKQNFLAIFLKSKLLSYVQNRITCYGICFHSGGGEVNINRNTYLFCYVRTETTICNNGLTFSEYF